MPSHSGMTERDPSVIFISGSSNSGKTTLIEQLIPRLLRRGIRVGTVKHAHAGCDMDHPGKDSWRHTEAGASAVTVIAPRKSVLFVQTEREMPLFQAIKQMAPHVDLVLVEGYKETDGPRILFKPAAGEDVHIDDKICCIGVQPDTLSPIGLERIVSFLLAHAQGHTVLEEGRKKSFL